MNDVWIVEHIWNYDGCPDDFANVYVHDIKAIFDSEDKAKRWIQGKLKELLDRQQNQDKNAVIAEEKQMCKYCNGEKCGELCKYDRIELLIDKIPSLEDIKCDKYLDYRKEHLETYSYLYYKQGVG